MNNYWCIPKKDDPDFIACMEDVLDVYELPYNAERSVVCMDEKPYQLLGDARQPLPMHPGNDRKTDSEYVRNGTCSIFAFIEPFGSRRHISVKEHRTAVNTRLLDWSENLGIAIYFAIYSHQSNDKDIIDAPNKS